MSQQVTVILLGSQAHVGKDTLGELLIEKEGFKRFGFADKLKAVVADLYDFSHEQMFGDLKNVPDKRYPKRNLNADIVPGAYFTPRETLQDFGQEERARFPDIWADYVCRQMLTASQADQDKFVVTDFRFPNEHTVVERFAKKHGWKVISIKLSRPDGLRGEVAGATNISETALDTFALWSFKVNNSTSSKEELYTTYKEVTNL